jgi:hypothetical protein
VLGHLSLCAYALVKLTQGLKRRLNVDKGLKDVLEQRSQKCGPRTSGKNEDFEEKKYIESISLFLQKH